MKFNKLKIDPKLGALVIVFGVYLLAAVAHAGPPKGGGEPKLDQATLNTMFFQAINVAILFAGLLWFVWPSIRDFVKTRARSFDEASQKAQLELQRAHAQMQDLQQKIQTLQNTRNDALVRARAEAAELKKQIEADSKEKAERYKKEIQFQLKMELEKAKQQLRAELMNLAIHKATIDLKAKLSKEDHSKLLTGFTEGLKEKAL